MRANELRKVRKHLGLTQKQLADYLGYSRPETISDWERGIAPVPKVVEKLLRLQSSLAREVVT